MQTADNVGRVDFIETGTFTDSITNGIPRGRILELWGDSGVGKSTLVLQWIASAQEKGLKCLFIDVELAFNSAYAESVGVNTKKLGLIQHPTAEEIIDELVEEIESKKWDLVVLDSIGALSVRNESEKGSGEKIIGGQASIVARFCRRIVPVIYFTNTALVVINHSFTDIMTGAIKTSGGKKLEYHRSVSVRLKQKFGVSIKQGTEKVGYVIVAECKRNKLSNTEGKTCEGQMLIGKGFRNELSLLDEALRKGVITKVGNTHFFGEEKLGTIGKVREWIAEHQEEVKALL